MHALLLFASLPRAFADYQIAQGYSTAACSGAPIVSFYIAGGACNFCSGPNEYNFCAYSCINSTFGEMKVYPTADCSGVPSYTYQQPGLTCAAGGEVFGEGARLPFFGLSQSSLCLPGQYAKPATGKVVATVPSYSAGVAPPSCDVAPNGVLSYVTDVCMPDPATLQSAMATCGPGYAELQHFSDQSCGGAAYVKDAFPLGCSLSRNGNSTLVGCTPSSPGAAAAPSALSAQLLYGTGGAAALLALLLALAWWLRRGGKQQQQQQQQYAELAAGN